MLQHMRQDTGMAVWMAIAAGSAVGGVLRHLVTEAVMRLTGPGFPWGTLAVNVSGSIAIGGVLALVQLGIPGTWPAPARHAAMTGLLGGFTTFSAFSLQTTTLWLSGGSAAAVLNIGLSTGLCLVGCWAGYAAAMSWAR
jgi:CrcB protein